MSPAGQKQRLSPETSPQTITPGKALAAFKAAAPFLGFPSRIVHGIDWLFRFTQSQDWTGDYDPIVWPSAALQQHDLDLGRTQVKTLNRRMAELGLIEMRDSPNGRRYGHRDKETGAIVEAYGFCLAPLRRRYAEFLEVAAAGKAARAQLKALRRRVSIARRDFRQVLGACGEMKLHSDEWQHFEETHRACLTACAGIEIPESLLPRVLKLEENLQCARDRLQAGRAALARAAHPVNPMETGPEGPEYRPHQYTYKSDLDRENDTVAAAGREDSASSALALPTATPAPMTTPRVPTALMMGARDKTAVHDGAGSGPTAMDQPEPTLRIHPDELLSLAPRLRTYVLSNDPGWPEIVDAAGHMRRDLGIDHHLWGKACLTMGRHGAAVALAIVSTKPRGYFRSSAAGYFFGMVAKAKAGKLNLPSSIWGLRKTRQ
ncbi:plasmid replication protein RepC [Rhodovastum atsumiense]|nr:plasmid replication protein RepC [Rhodovastum atsumiense]